MTDIRKLFTSRNFESTIALLNEALALAKERQNLGWYDIQNALKIGFEDACILQDWLADSYKTEPPITKYWIQCGRTYVLNNPLPSLAGMAERVRIGDRRAFLIMQELQKRGLISLLSDFSFERHHSGTTEAGFIRQMKRWAKKYRGRCEPELLMRTMYVDYETAYKLAEYGRDHLGFKWRGSWK